MKSKNMKAIFALSVAAGLTGSAGAAIVYNPVVVNIGDGTTVVSSAAYAINQRIYASGVPGQAAPLATSSFLSTGATVNTRLTASASATSEGTLTNNPGLSNNAAKGLASTSGYTYMGGYDAVAGTASVNGATANANRVVGRMDIAVNNINNAVIVQGQTQATAYNANNFRGATGLDNGTDVYTAGTGTAAQSGWRYFNSNTQLVATPTNVRTVEVLNGQLFGSTGSGTTGVYAIGAGTPTASGQTATLLVATTSPYEFVLIDDPNNAASTTNSFGFDTAYVADDGVGIIKFTYDGTAWTNAYTLRDTATTFYRGLAGQLDVDTGKVTLWATTADGTRLQEVTDNGAGSTFTTLATAPTNTVFRGVALSPVPEPGSIGLLAVGTLSVLARRRARRA